MTNIDQLIYFIASEWFFDLTKQIPRPISYKGFYPVRGHEQHQYGGGLGGEQGVRRKYYQG